MKKIRLTKKTREKIWKFARPVVIVLSAIAITSIILYAVGASLVGNYLSPVDENDATPIEFVIEDGWGASTIAKHLYEACGEGEPGLIRNKAIFKIYVDFMGKSKDLQAGRYYLSKNMDIPAIIDTLCKGGENTKIVKVTIPEGTTVEGIVDILKDSGMNLDREEFLSLCETGEKFTNFKFVDNVVVADEDRNYALEGYLFPDTYDLYIDASSETVIRKMLSRFNDVCYSGESPLVDRAKELGMSMDEAIALASVIEKESVTEEDFYRVSAVFHNRMDIGMRLQSDAPLAYIFGTDKIMYTAEELRVDSPYNTHVYEGVPIGAICNPGKLAIEAALSPDSEFRSDGYLYFCLKNREEGNVYAKTYEEHNANVEKYRDQW